MLGKRPRPNLLRTTSKSQLNAACTRFSEEASIATGTIPTPNKSYGSSHVVVVGFKLASEAVHEACDSPRSVLEPGALCCRDVSPAGQPNSSRKVPNTVSVSKSPRSILGSLLSSPGIGLGIVAAMKTQESVAEKNTLEASKVSRPVPVPAIATAAAMASSRAANVNTNGQSHLNCFCDGGFAQHAMDHVYYANCGTQSAIKQANYAVDGSQNAIKHVNFVNDGYQSAIKHVNYANDGSQNAIKHVNYANDVSQNAIKHASYAYDSSKNAIKHANHVVADVRNGNSNPNAMNHFQCDTSNILHSPDDEEDEDEDDLLVDNDNVSGVTHVIYEDDEDQDDEDEEKYQNGEQKLNFDHDMGIKQSIFSTGSPASSCCSFGNQGRDFLSSCYLCKRRLGQGSDIYMYRGDQAFCSAECRYQQIALDDYKERRSTATNCYPGSSSHHHRMFAVASPAVA